MKEELKIAISIVLGVIITPWLVALFIRSCEIAFRTLGLYK